MLSSRLQSQCLWGGVRGYRTIPWVRRWAFFIGFYSCACHLLLQIATALITSLIAGGDLSNVLLVVKLKTLQFLSNPKSFKISRVQCTQTDSFSPPYASRRGNKGRRSRRAVTAVLVVHACLLWCKLIGDVGFVWQ